MVPSAAPASCCHPAHKAISCQTSSATRPMSAAHYETTGPEIFRQTGGDVDIVVAGIGTGGTLMGISRYLTGSEVLKVRIFGVEPGLGSQDPGTEKPDGVARCPGFSNAERLDGIVACRRRGCVHRQLACWSAKAGIFYRHVQRRRPGRFLEGRPGASRPHDRDRFSGPRRALPQHLHFPLDLREMPPMK